MTEPVTNIVSTGTETERSSEAAGAQQTFNSLVESLPEDLRGNASLRLHKDFGSFVKDYTNKESLLGRKGVILPGDDEADVARFLKELGRPDSPDQYNRDSFTLPEELPWDAEIDRRLTDLLHSSGVTQGQFEKLLPGYAELQAQAYQEMQRNSVLMQEKSTTELRKEFGNEYDTNINLAARTILTVFGEEEGEVLLNSRLKDGSALGNNKTFIKGMVEISKMIGEDKLMTDAVGERAGRISPAEAMTQIKAKQSDKGFMDAYLDQKSPGHPAANSEMDRLYALAHDK